MRKNFVDCYRFDYQYQYLPFKIRTNLQLNTGKFAGKSPFAGIGKMARANIDSEVVFTEGSRFTIAISHQIPLQCPDGTYVAESHVKFCLNSLN